MKKIINNVEDIVNEMCEGLVCGRPEIEFDPKYRIVKRVDIDTSKVSLISGGGSGHEPAHAGFVGKGMITAAVCGDVFASPSTIQVYNAIVKTQSDAGTLLIIKNYSGDCMNFEAAKEMAEDDDIRVECVYVNDDIAVQDSLYTTGRRGVAGTVFVHKIAGAAAEAGMCLEEVKRIAEKTISNVKSIGFALTSCTVPAKGSPTFGMGDSEIEFGVGIHGEPGIERCKTGTSAQLADRMMQKLSDELGLKEGDRCAVMINGLGATPLMELYILNRDVQEILAGKKVMPVTTLVGNYMTALDMAGASVTLLKLDEELEDLLMKPTDVAAFR